MALASAQNGDTMYAFITFFVPWQSYVDKNDVFPDFDDMFPVDKQFAFLSSPTFVPWYDYAYPPIFRVTQRNIAHFAKFSAVLGVDDFLGAKL